MLLHVAGNSMTLNLWFALFQIQIRVEREGEREKKVGPDRI